MMLHIWNDDQREMKDFDDFFFSIIFRVARLMEAPPPPSLDLKDILAKLSRAHLHEKLSSNVTLLLVVKDERAFVSHLFHLSIQF